MMEEMLQNPFDFLGQETYEDALQKNAEENKGSNRVPHFKMDSVGTYVVRILPIAPTRDSEGKWVLDRKGYEYPVKCQVLKIKNPAPKSKKDALFYVNVCHTEHVKYPSDPIDTYVQVASELYADDEALLTQLRKGGYEGGLKWSRQRTMYIYDLNNKKTGIQQLALSYSQYKELEDRKLNVWKKLVENNTKCLCPISSPNDAYGVEIVRKVENKKTSYSFNIDILSGVKPLSEDEMKALLDAPRLPESIYRYNRFHFEATIEFLKQCDERFGIHVMDSQSMKDVIAQINMELPADDKSHFSFGKKEGEGEGGEDNASDELTLDALWNRLDDLKNRGIEDKSEEGQALRDDIRAFIDDNNISVRVTRVKTNNDLLEEIEDRLNDEEPEEGVDAPESNTPSVDSDNSEDEEEDDYNYDTNEPARKPRAARPQSARTRNV